MFDRTRRFLREIREKREKMSSHIKGSSNPTSVSCEVLLRDVEDQWKAFKEYRGRGEKPWTDFAEDELRHFSTINLMIMEKCPSMRAEVEAIMRG